MEGKPQKETSKLKVPYTVFKGFPMHTEVLEELTEEIADLQKPVVINEGPTYSSFFMNPLERPEKILNKFYAERTSEIMKAYGLYHISRYNYVYWMQTYDKDSTGHPQHHHYEQNRDVILSWVHFLKTPPGIHCFRFTNGLGIVNYPKEQLEGNIIVFPSWALHEVVPHNQNFERIIIAGNIQLDEIS